MNNRNGQNDQEETETLPHKVVLLAFVLGLGAWALGAGVLIHQRHEYRKIRWAYEQALGAFVTSRVPMANAAELESLKVAISQSKPVVNLVEGAQVYKADGTTETLKGKSPVTDFGIYRTNDGKWIAGSPTVK